MNKRTLTILLMILVALGVIWLMNVYTPQAAETPNQTQAQSELACYSTVKLQTETFRFDGSTYG
ncbi:MAG: hypothetical protein R2881_03780 [Eubacteriales bacterium]